MAVDAHWIKIGSVKIPLPKVQPATWGRIIRRGLLPIVAAWVIYLVPMPPKLSLLRAALILATGIYFFLSLRGFVNDLNKYTDHVRRSTPPKKARR